MSFLSRYRSLVLGSLCAIITLVCCYDYFCEMRVVGVGLPPGFLLKAENAAIDTLETKGRKAPQNSDLYFLGIDDRSQNVAGVSPQEIEASPALRAMQNGFPWDRMVYAMILNRLSHAGAKLVIFDLLFSTPREGDEPLKDAVSLWGNRLVLASDCEFDPSRDNEMVPSFPSDTILPKDGHQKARVGFVNFFPDSDGVLRRARSRLVQEQTNRTFDANSTVYDSFATAAVLQIGRPDLVPVEPNIMFRFTGPAGTFQPHSVYEIFVPALWENTFKNGDVFKDKIVMVGPSGSFQHDAHRVAVDKGMPGPEIHLNVLNAFLNQEFLKESDLKTDIELIVFAGLAAWVVGAAVRQPITRFILLVVLSALGVGIVWFIYNRFGWLTTMTTPLLVMNGAAGTGAIYDFVLERMEKARVRRTLERYVSKNVVKEILDNPQSYITTKGGERRPVALLFTDLRGFTAMTESADSVELVAKLNEYLEEMVKPVFANDGTLDKFIGDAIMAVWGNVTTRTAEIDVRSAILTALQMKEALVSLNERWRARGLDTWAMGIGVNYGVVVAGEIGSPEKKEITVIGDSVNLASRIESLTKKYHVEILVGEQASSEARDYFHFQSVDLVQVVGKKKPVKVSTVHGLKSVPLPETMQTYLQRFEESLQKYLSRNFREATTGFEECLKIKPDDYLASMYLGRSNALLETPPGESWDGVFVMDKK